ncbi:hypothetical protein ACLOJK_002100 [Asimina triloba]
MNSQNLGSPEVLVIPADVSKLEDCKDMVEKTINRFGRLDHLVVNAGLGGSCLFEEIENISGYKHMMALDAVLPASKAAVVKFYETLRTEVGSDVDFTIVALGRVGTAISKGKVMNKDGKVIDNHKLPEIYETQPEESVEECAKAILKAACRGKRLLIWPMWYWLPLLTATLLPEANEWLARRYVATCMNAWFLRHDVIQMDGWSILVIFKGCGAASYKSNCSTQPSIVSRSAMDSARLTYTAFSLFLPPFVLLFFSLILPLIFLYKLLLFFLPTPNENTAGKVVLITGASSGIGEQLAYEYARRGASLVLAARREKALQEVAENSRRLGSPEVLVIPTDVSKAEACKRMVEETIAHFGQLNHLASKAALVKFYEVLRVELGSTVKITIVTPGYVESEITSGKTMLKDGSIGVNPEARDALIGPIPAGDAKECAEAIVVGACQGARYVTWPAWYRVAYPLMFLIPELVESFSHSFYVGGSGAPDSNPLSKRLLDKIGADKFYPASMRKSNEKFN